MGEPALILFACIFYGCVCYAIGYATGYAIRSTYKSETATEVRKDE